MKGLLKYLSPFAPDQSGVCAVLYDLGGLSLSVTQGDAQEISVDLTSPDGL